MREVTDVAGGDAAGSDESAHVPHAFELYTQVSLLAPTLIAGLLVAFDHPVPTLATFAVWATVAAVWVQQLALVVRAGLLPSRWWSGAGIGAWATSRVAVVVVLLAGLGLLAYGLREGRPAWLWALPYAVTLADATLARTVRSDDGLLPRLPRGDAAALALAVLAPVVVALVMTPDWSGLSVAAVVAGALVVQVGQVWWLDVVAALEASRGTSVALARTEERLRFAGELHDLQGHELQNIVMQADLARTLLRRDEPGDATQVAEILDAIHETAAGTLRQTRAIAHGYRAVDFEQEVAGAVEVLRAAGVALTVSGRLAAVPPDARHLAGLLVREAATNLLRHSAATTADLAVTRAGDEVRVVVRDPGPPRPEGHLGLDHGSGLESLTERAASAGLRLDHGPDGSGWQLTLTCSTEENP
ncbi:hypothetical protein GCM10011331_02330 [Flavimobilis marinus]|uniref:histidine kinase n=1 Tax=Flavimobilis marinus TaxID=285351 RepID=A0A1I2DW07_9MICO|nr:histidine kinase [Flavimobilis marinus]GHG44146.1 hypothetical protein GCM10011331_02330 [Flavimobilis marinus]SFE84862.1 two-component system, NarL family, sensor histidine kinase DesK [Flavimobilis marinus]